MNKPKPKSKQQLKASVAVLRFLLKYGKHMTTTEKQQLQATHHVQFKINGKQYEAQTANNTVVMREVIREKKV